MSGVPATRSAKRALDLLGALLLAPCAVALIAVAAAAVKMIDPGPALFRQRREGLAGHPFVLWKVRTMRADSEKRLRDLLASDPAAAREWSDFRRLSDDPRLIPFVGAFLRRTSLDELPQLWNVLRGEMSLVGPRPLELEVTARASADALRERRAVRPGLTGLWQVSGRSDLAIEEMYLLDGRYCREWSLRLDLRILGRTALVLLSRRGAY